MVSLVGGTKNKPSNCWMHCGCGHRKEKDGSTSTLFGTCEQVLAQVPLEVVDNTDTFLVNFAGERVSPFTNGSSPKITTKKRAILFLTVLGIIVCLLVCKKTLKIWIAIIAPFYMPILILIHPVYINVTRLRGVFRGQNVKMKQWGVLLYNFLIRQNMWETLWPWEFLAFGII